MLRTKRSPCRAAAQACSMRPRRWVYASMAGLTLSACCHPAHSTRASQPAAFAATDEDPPADTQSWQVRFNPLPGTPAPAPLRPPAGGPPDRSAPETNLLPAASQRSAAAPCADEAVAPTEITATALAPAGTAPPESGSACGRHGRQQMACDRDLASAAQLRAPQRDPHPWNPAGLRTTACCCLIPFQLGSGERTPEQH